MKIVPLDGPVGAEVRDVDLSKPLNDADLATMRKAFADHLLLLVRDQPITGEDHDRWIKYLGPLETFDHGAQHEYMTNKVTENRSPAGQGRLLFHNDGAYREHPRAGTSLSAIEVSPTSPPTAFANGVRAYAQLAPSVKERLEGLQLVSTLSIDDPEAEVLRTRVAEFPPGRSLADVKHAVHPAVMTLPHSGRKALFVSELYASHFEELGPDSAEGEELIQELFSVMYDESNVYAHHYANGDTVVWDNLGVQHARFGSVDTSPRPLRRLVLKSVSH
ncbi:TauD/TfdA family dioxygenase [Streptomyces sp. NPDC050625]|uniref:TauD/TfdA dioxygenase family protein n=1 Tax=Streptomyces sp. NPDC050625 TaxID=3154629 RepID=UPI00342FADF4